jgi:hypothetical protein
MENKISIKEISKLLKTTKEDGIEFVFLSPPGIGKTAIIEKFFGNLGMKVATITPSSMDREDWKGIKTIDFAAIHNNGSKETKLISTRPSWLDADVLFIDEITNASKWEMTPIMKLITERMIGEHKFGGKIVAAGNTPENSVLADNLPETIRTRLVPVVLKAEPDFYRPYFIKRGLTIISDFLRYLSPEDFDNLSEDPTKGSTNPRTLEKVGVIINKKELPYELKESLAIQALGSSNGIKFINFLKSYLKQISTEELKMMDKEELKKKIESLPFDAKVASFNNIIKNMIEFENEKVLTRSIEQLSIAHEIDLVINEIVIENLAVTLNEDILKRIFAELKDLKNINFFKKIMKEIEEKEKEIKKYFV